MCNTQLEIQINTNHDQKHCNRHAMPDLWKFSLIIIIVRQVLRVAEVIQHPSYGDASDWTNDIALLKVLMLLMRLKQSSCLILKSFLLISSKLQESVDLDVWSPACLPTAVIIIIISNIIIITTIIIIM